MNILVRAPNWIGDQILAYPFFYYLRRAYPGAKITSVCVSWVKDLQFQDLVDEVFVLPTAEKRSLWARFKAVDEGAQHLAQRKWSIGWSLPNSLSAAWLLKRAKVRDRFGYKVDARGWLLNRGQVWDSDPSRHRAQAYVDLLPPEQRPAQPVREFWGIQGEETKAVESQFDAAAAWGVKTEITPPAEKYYVLAPGATALSRRWEIQNFTSLARAIFREKGWTGVVVGGPKEKKLAQMLCEDPVAKLLDFAGRGAVSAYWRVFQSAQFTVSNESGLAHVAAICGSPVQIVCGAADPRRTTPLGANKIQVSVNPVECWPCERNTCYQRDPKFLQCLRGIGVDRIWTEIRQGFGLD